METFFFSLAGLHTGVAWLSSARVVRCWVKSRNERNPYSYLPAGNAGNYRKTAGAKPEEGGDEVKSSWSLWVGLHACYNGTYRVMQYGNVELIIKRYLSSDCTLQLECMKSESLVIADQHAAVNTFSGLVHTARRTMGVSGTWSWWANVRGS